MKTQTTRRVSAGLLAAVLVLALSGCNKALMVGDSVTVGAGPVVDQRLTDNGWEATTDGRVGRNTDEVRSVIRQLRADSNVLVVESGYNDAGDSNVFRSRMAGILDDNADVGLIVVVTLNESRGYYSTANAIIWDLASTHPNVRVADWASVTRYTGGLVSGDGVHLTSAGNTAMANLIADTVGPVNPW